MALEKQMELFEDGGLLDEGGTVDEESGNDVPVGSLKKEVRDDIPAQLSEGEFVMPADVVRYHGLDKMMALRDEAKLGLARMEAMGQMGNSDEAVLPDDVPFGLEDLDIAEDPLEMQVGGFVQPFTTMPPAPNFSQPYTPPTQSFTPMAPTTIPDFGSFIQPPTGMRPEIRVYINPQTGEERQITFINNQPTVPIPPGFVLKSQYTPPPPTPTTTPTVTQTTEREEDPSDGREFGGGPAGLTMKDSKIAVLTQLDNALPPEQRTGFGQKIAGIKDKYKAPEGLAGFNIVGGIGRAFKESGEISQALKDFDYDAAAAAAGLTREQYDDVVNELSGEVFSGYRDPITGEVSGQKDPRNIFQRASDFVSGVEPSGDIDDLGTAPTGVETARVTVEPATTVTEAVDKEISKTANIAEGKKDLLSAFNTLGLSEAEKMQFALDLATGVTGTKTYGPAGLGTTVNFDDYSDDVREVASRTINVVESKGDDNLKGTLADARASLDAVDYSSEGIKEAMGQQQQNKEEEDRQTQNYRNKGYSASDAKSAAKNKVAADNAAKKQARDRGESEEHIAKTTAVTDSKGNPVTQRDAVTGDIKKNEDGSDKVVTSEPEKDEPTGGKSIVCTEMYRQTQLDDWARAMKIWDVHQKKYLTPYHEKGYHWLFKPWVRGMRKSVILTSVGAYLAKARTQHIKHILTHGKVKDDIVGNVWCKIIHPIVYIAGRTKEWLKL